MLKHCAAYTLVGRTHKHTTHTREREREREKEEVHTGARPLDYRYALLPASPSSLSKLEKRSRQGEGAATKEQEYSHNACAGS
jgi:hypothetical protein